MALLSKVLIVGLAAYATGQTVAWREGPWSIFENLRNHYIRLGGTEMHRTFESAEEGEVEVERYASARARMLTCPYCAAMYAGLFFALLSKPKDVGTFLLTWFGGMGVQVFLQSREHE